MLLIIYYIIRTYYNIVHAQQSVSVYWSTMKIYGLLPGKELFDCFFGG